MNMKLTNSKDQSLNTFDTYKLLDLFNHRYMEGYLYEIIRINFIINGGLQ